MLPLVTVFVFEPSSLDATKSLPAASDTVRFTVTVALGAGFSHNLNDAAVPSVVEELPASSMVMVGV